MPSTGLCGLFVLVAAVCLLLTLRTSFDNQSQCQVPPHWLEDDYCDRPEDGCDETHTAACAGLASGLVPCHTGPGLIRRGYLGDAVCDCCDGSDEPPGLCADTCEGQRRKEARSRQEHIARLRRLLALRERLRGDATACIARLAQEREKVLHDLREMSEEIQDLQTDGGIPYAMYHAFMQLRNQRAALEALLARQKETFGPDLEFCHLREECFTTQSNEVTYRGGTTNPEAFDFNFTVCPFRYALQKQVTGLPPEDEAGPVVLGGWLGWERPLTLAEEVAERSRHRQRQALALLRAAFDQQQQAAEGSAAHEPDGGEGGQEGNGEVQDKNAKAGPDSGTESDAGPQPPPPSPAPPPSPPVEHPPRSSTTTPEDERLVQFGYHPGIAAPGAVMVFAGGAPCWGGPPRTLRLALRCGDVRLCDLREDGKCTYTATLETPLACHPAALAELMRQQSAAPEEEGGPSPEL